MFVAKVLWVVVGGVGCCDKSVKWQTGQLLHSCLLFVKLYSTVQHFCSRLNVIISAVYSNNNRKRCHEERSKYEESFWIEQKNIEGGSWSQNDSN